MKIFEKIKKKRHIPAFLVLSVAHLIILQALVTAGKRGGVHVARLVATLQPTHALVGSAVGERLGL